MNSFLKNMRIEYIVIIIFFVLFIMFSATRCNKTKSKLAEKETPAVVDAPKDTIVHKPDTAIQKPKIAAIKDTSISSKPTIVEKKVTKLFVTIDGLNVRSEPNVKAKSFGKLKLYDEVVFMNDVTKETTKLSLGTSDANEPWVKIKTKRGTIGWVYGAGVSYYKTKKKGVLE
ncbi:MAG: SH3 domain-containing protein [Saprospiraceae bacterium]|nr:SH3 domain-containing protein [Saprospiraceae bacterium]